MTSSVMDRQGYSLGSENSSFFSEELQFPTEKQVGFRKSDSLTDQHRIEGMPFVSGNNSVSSSPHDKLHQAGANGVEKMDLRQHYILSDEKTRFGLEHDLVGLERMTSPANWRPVDHSSTVVSDWLNQPASLLMMPNHVGVNGSSYENGLLSSSLPDLLKKKLALTFNNAPLSQPIGAHSNFDEDEPFESMEEIEAQTIGNLLPDDDDLLAGVTDNVVYSYQRGSGDDIDDDIFYSGGGIELETDGSTNKYNSAGLSFGVPNGEQRELNGIFAGEHSFGKHPSRTLFVGNISSSIEDAELKALFEQYGDIHTLYTSCKHRGFVMVSYYDIRSARNAMRALQRKPLKHWKLDIHYSISKENPSEEDANQETIVVFNLDSTVSNDELRQIFGVYGEIKEIIETPDNCHYKFIEFYDVRAAESALALNGSDIAGKKIKIEPVCPGVARSHVQQLSAEIDQEELNGCNQSNPINSQSGCSGSVLSRPITSNGLESGAIKSFQSAVRAPLNPFMEATFRGISSSVSHSLSSPIRISSIGNHCKQPSSGDIGHSLGHMNFAYHGMPNSLPEYRSGVTNGVPYKLSTMTSLGMNIIRPAEIVDGRHYRKVTSNSLKTSAFDHNGGAFGPSADGSFYHHGNQCGWNSRNSFQHQVQSSIPWSNSPSFRNDIMSNSHGLPRTPPSHVLNSILPLHHHVGSAPAVNPMLWDKQHAYHGDATNSTAFHPRSLGSMGFPGSPQLHQLEFASRSIFPHASGSCLDHPTSPAHVGIPSPQPRCLTFHGRNQMVQMSGSYDSPSDRIRSRRNDSSANQSENKKQYELDIDCIMRGEDSRTTLMLKNIPNKYSAKMLLAAIDENHRGTYDFIYLPIDFKNKCNVGYAFINMTAPQHIVPFYQTFNGKKWEKFNSEKVASLAYARIQGKSALIAHFQNSSLMNEDKRCRPIIFHSDGPSAGDQEPFPVGANIRSRSGRSRASNGNEERHHESPSMSPDGEGSNDALESTSGSSRDLE